MLGHNLLGLLLASSLGACSEGAPQKPPDLASKTTVNLTVTSSAFQSGQSIPNRHSASGGNIAPPLAWSQLPPKTKSVALIVDDPDAPRAGGYVHWVLYNLSPETNSFAAGTPPGAQVAALGSALQGRSDHGDLGYFGPQPPPGKPHHYHFHIYALDQILPLRPGANRRELAVAMSGHVLAQGDLVGVYQRR